MPTIPAQGGSNNTWGTELDAWLFYDHNADGSHNSQARSFEFFGGQQNQSVALQTTAWNNYLSWATGNGGGLCLFGPYSYQHLPSLDVPAYGGIMGAGFATILQSDSTVSSHGVTSHKSSNGTLDPNGISIYLSHFWLDMSQISAGNVNGSGLRSVVGTQDGIHCETNPTIWSGAANANGGTASRFGFDHDNHTVIRDVFVQAAPRDGFAASGWGDAIWDGLRAYGCGRYGFNPSFDMVIGNCTAGGSGSEGFHIAVPAIRGYGNKSFYSGQLTTSAGFHFTGINQGGVIFETCEAQDNTANAYSVDSCAATIRLTGTADSNSTASAGTYAALDVFGSTALDAVIECSDRFWDGVHSTQTTALTLRSSSNGNTIRLKHKAVNGSSVIAPINGLTDYSTCTSNVLAINSYGARQALASTSSMTPDPTQGSTLQITMGGNITTFNVPAAGNAWPNQEMTFEFLQDGSGGHTLSGASASYKPSPASAAVVTAAGAAAATWTTTLNTRTILTYTCVDGTVWRQKGVGVTGVA